MTLTIRSLTSSLYQKDFDKMLEKDVRLFIRACRQPLLFVQSPTFECVCAYIDGYDTATRGGCLQGFRHWLLSEGVEWTNLPWWGLIRRYCFPNNDPSGSLTDAESNEALQALADHLERYLECLLSGGLEVIFCKYNSWLSQRTDENTKDLRDRLKSVVSPTLPPSSRGTT